MAKIWRRKRNGKLIGSYLVLVKGQRVNLRTEDANVARKRAALAMRGEWPNTEDKRKAAASATAASLEVEPESEPEPLTAAGKAEPTMPLDTEPAPESTGLPPPPNAGTTDDAAAVRAAVEAASASSEDGHAGSGASVDEEAKRAEWRARFASMFGGEVAGQGLGGMSVGQAVAMGSVGLLAEIVGRAGAWMKPPRYMTFVLGENDWRLNMLALGWDEQIRRWGMNLTAIEPWHAILAGTGILAATMALTMTATEPGKEASQPAGKP